MGDLRVGDWIRFYRHDRLVTGVVMYIWPRDGRKTRIQTDIGAIKEDYVLEVRRESVKQEKAGP